MSNRQPAVRGSGDKGQDVNMSQTTSWILPTERRDRAQVLQPCDIKVPAELMFFSSFFSTWCRGEYDHVQPLPQAFTNSNNVLEAFAQNGRLRLKRCPEKAAC
ncbi:hypothetical protein BaRGS_00009877 [Batillaria attramentaria]|uniref:Uncharacterized protein n=1 Tax=Batillaria attramentaria TaxID=370345 RepID=A0ABD0LH60_9CAEN